MCMCVSYLHIYCDMCMHMWYVWFMCVMYFCGAYVYVHVWCICVSLCVCGVPEYVCGMYMLRVHVCVCVVYVHISLQYTHP